MLALPASNSAFGQLNLLDLKKIARMALVGAIGVFLVQIAQGTAGIDFGAYKPIVDLLAMLAVEAGRRMMATGGVSQ